MVHGHQYVRAERWLNVGCGLLTHEGFWNTDMYNGEGVDQVLDLMKLPLPFENDSWDFILASHVLEHIPHHVVGHDQDGDFLTHLINEFIRVLTPGGILEIHTPIGPDGMYVIDHCRFVDQITFRGWDPEYIATSLFSEVNQRSKPKMRMLRKYVKRYFQLGPINSWHTRNHLGLEVGKVHQHILIYEVVK
jgi:predicted SAM-dependent methyltransferase